MPVTRSTISFTRDGMNLIRAAAKRQVAVRPRARADARGDGRDDDPYPMSAVAAQLPAIGDQRSLILLASSWRVFPSSPATWPGGNPRAAPQPTAPDNTRASA